MVEINPNAAGLQTQLQAQLQAKAGRPAKPVARVQEPVDRSTEGRTGQTGTGRQLVKTNPRSGALSSDADIEAASERVAGLGGKGQREAPVGRLSVRANEGRNVPLGQIVDIWV